MSGGGDIVLQGGVGGGGKPDRAHEAIDGIISLCKRQFTAAFLLLLLSFIAHFATGASMSELRGRVEALELVGTAAVASRS